LSLNVFNFFQERAKKIKLIKLQISENCNALAQVSTYDKSEFKKECENSLNNRSKFLSGLLREINNRTVIFSIVYSAMLVGIVFILCLGFQIKSNIQKKVEKEKAIIAEASAKAEAEKEEAAKASITKAEHANAEAAKAEAAIRVATQNLETLRAETAAKLESLKPDIKKAQTTDKINEIIPVTEKLEALKSEFAVKFERLKSEEENIQTDGMHVLEEAFASANAAGTEGPVKITAARMQTFKAEAAKAVTAKAEAAKEVRLVVLELSSLQASLQALKAIAAMKELNNYPRQCKTTRQIKLSGENSEIYVIPEGKVIQLIRQDGNKYIVRDDKYEFYLKRDDFTELNEQ